jgi:putative ABC transport system substrate-binding protein
MRICVQRREFIAGLGSAAAWPLTARAQQGDRIRRIGVLMALENDPVMKARISAFTQALAGLGWTAGRNVRMDLRWGRADIDRVRALARELVGLQPDIILTNGTPPTAAVQRETGTIPIVFVNVGEPLGIVERLDRPGGNTTGFADYEATLGGKWLELLSEIAPGLKRAAIMFNPDLPGPPAYMASLETAARSLKVAPIKIRKRAAQMASKRRAARLSCTRHAWPRQDMHLCLNIPSLPRARSLSPSRIIPWC